MRNEADHVTDTLTLRHWRTVELRPRAPFHFDSTMHKPDHFPSRDNLSLIHI